MMLAVCPPPEALKSYLLGSVSDEEAERLDAHLRGCPACLSSLQHVEAADALVRDLRDQRCRPPVRNPLLEELRLRLRRLRSVAAVDPSLNTPASASLSGTFSSASTSPPPDCRTHVPYPFLAPAQTAGELGRLGHYRVLRELGQGGMGIVFVAEDLVLKRQVALKVIKPGLAATAEARQRFLREAQATAALCHDHIVVLHHVGEENGVPYLVMPLLAGETLEARLKRSSTLPVAETLRVGRELVLGLAAAHERGIIHRDVKPGNLWLEAPTDRVKILDFGLAGMEHPEGERTSSSAILGTPGYMAPEQVGGKADARSDLFSLGCVLYRLTTGQLPHPGETPLERLRSLADDALVSPTQLNPAVPPAVSGFILKLLAKKPADRPVSAAVVAKVLETFLGQLPAVAPVPAASPVREPAPREAIPLQGPWPVARRRWRLALAIALSATAAFLLVGVSVLAFALWGTPGKQNANAGGGGGGGDGPPPAFGRRDPGHRPADETRGGGGDGLPPAFGPCPYVSQPAPLKGFASWTIDTTKATRLDMLVFLQDGRLAIRGLAGRDWYFCDRTGHRITEAPFTAPGYLAVAPDGNHAARFVGQAVELVEGPGTKEPRSIKLTGPVLPKEDLWFSPDSKTLLVSEPERVWLYDVERGSPRGSPIEGRGGPAWSPDSKVLAIILPTANSGKSVLGMVEVSSGKIRRIELEGGLESLSWSPNGQRLAVIVSGGLRILNSKTGEEECRSREEYADGRGCRWSLDGKKLAFRSRDKEEVGNLVLWDVDQRKETQRLRHNYEVSDWVFAADGKTLVSLDKGVRFWDLETGRLRGTILLLDTREDWLVISADGHYNGSNGVEARKLFFYKGERKKDGKVWDYDPRDFKSEFGWKNDPGKVKLLAP
jgi:tRNA A-37 threonylcarbamoyl transferase component Bud32